MDYKYNLGDRVLIIDTVPIGRCEDDCYFTTSMDQYCGIETTITSIRSPGISGRFRREPRYSVSCDGGEWAWIESWLKSIDSSVDFNADVTALL